MKSKKEEQREWIEKTDSHVDGRFPGLGKVYFVFREGRTIKEYKPGQKDQKREFP